MQAFPLVWMILTSVKNQREVFRRSCRRGSTSAISSASGTPSTCRSICVNSLYVTTLTVVIVVFVATLAGYVFARFRFRGRDLLFYLFIGAMMIPGQAILIPMFQFLKAIGLLNTLTGLSLSYLGGAVAFSIFLMRVLLPEPAEGARRCRPHRRLHGVRRLPLGLSAARQARHRHGRDHPVDGHLERVHVLEHLHLELRPQDHPGGAVPGGRALLDRLYRRSPPGLMLGADPDRHRLSHPAEAVRPGTDRRRPQRADRSGVRKEAASPSDGDRRRIASAKFQTTMEDSPTDVPLTRSKTSRTKETHVGADQGTGDVLMLVQICVVVDDADKWAPNASELLGILSRRCTSPTAFLRDEATYHGEPTEAKGASITGIFGAIGFSSCREAARPEKASADWLDEHGPSVHSPRRLQG